MDLLYYLQTIRLACPDWFVTIIMIISESVIILAPMVTCCVFWSKDKKKGSYMLVSLAFALLLNELLKVTFCIYRPWILDSRITPVAQVLNTATNYSFPSSHSCAAASVCTSLNIAFPKNKTKTVITSVFVIFVLFARMFLGCHSLLDVCVGSATGILISILICPMLKDSFDEERFTKILLPVCLCLAGISIIYVIKKNYPLDYNTDGSLIVNPKDMFPDTLAACGTVAGVGIGLFLEKKFVGFSMPSSKRNAYLRCIVGVISFALLYAVILKKLFSPLDPSLAKFLRNAICTFIFLVAYPALFKKTN